jgi:hypothetical protein
VLKIGKQEKGKAQKNTYVKGGGKQRRLNLFFDLENGGVTFLRNVG